MAPAILVATPKISVLFQRNIAFLISFTLYKYIVCRVQLIIRRYVVVGCKALSNYINSTTGTSTVGWLHPDSSKDIGLQRLTSPRRQVRLTKVPQSPVSSNKREIRTSYTSILKLRLGRLNPVRQTKNEFHLSKRKELRKT